MGCINARHNSVRVPEEDRSEDTTPTMKSTWYVSITEQMKTLNMMIFIILDRKTVEN